LDYEQNKALMTVKIIQTVAIVSILVYAGILYWNLTYAGTTPRVPLDHYILTVTTVVLSVIAALVLIIGYFSPRWIPKRYKHDAQGLSSIHMVRCAFFESIAIYGLILGLLGTKWQISIIFFVFSAGALILTFPNEERWKKILEMVNTQSKSQ